MVGIKKKKQNIGQNRKFTRSKWVMFGLLIGVVLVTVGSVGALNGWFGGGGSIPEDTMTRGLAGYWNFDEGSGQNVYDATGYGNDGTLASSTDSSDEDPTWETGKVGGALEFDGVDDYVKIPDSASLDITGAITIEFWVKEK